MFRRMQWMVVGAVLCAGCANAVDDGETARPEIWQGKPVSQTWKAPVLPELLNALPIGPHEISDLVPTDEGFLVATGTGVSRWTYTDGLPCHTGDLSRPDGSPLGPCRELIQDKNGGVWICGTDSVGYLPKGEESPEWFTQKDGLPQGPIGDIAISEETGRVWVVTPHGLATIIAGEHRWRLFERHNLAGLSAHPSEDIVWCWQYMKADPMCMHTRDGLTIQFDLSTQHWGALSDIHILAIKPPGVSPAGLPRFCKASGWAWWPSSPPRAIDLSSGKLHSWPREPRWRRMEHGNTVCYSEQLGQLIFAEDGTGDIWRASDAGLWRYRQAENRWQPNKYLDKPIYGEAKVVRSLDGRTLYWSCSSATAALDVATGVWRPLWHVQKQASIDHPGPLLLSPDGRTLWQTGPWGVSVCDPVHQTGCVIDDNTVLGLTEAQFVRFDKSRKLALIVTPRGIVVTDYEGMPRATVTNPAPHVQGGVFDFLFSAGGDEVWCLAGGHPPAHVYFSKTRQWQMIPEAQSRGYFFGVALSKDRKTVWLAFRHKDEDSVRILQRKAGTIAWKPFAANMPEWLSPVEKFYVAPSGDELWIKPWADGLIRARLSDGKVTHYRKEHYSQDEGVVLKPLVGNSAADLVFLQKGTLAVCAAGGGSEGGLSLIDLKTDSVENFPLKDGARIEELRVEPDDRTVALLYGCDRLLRFDTQEKKLLPGLPHDTAEATRWMNSSFFRRASLAIEGDCFLQSDDRGIAKVNRAGDELDIFSPSPGKTGFRMTQILPIPATDEYLCALARQGETGIYRLNPQSRGLRLLRRFRGPVTALNIAPDGRVWAGLCGQIVRFDTTTGENVPLPADDAPRLPVATALHDPPAPASAKLVIAPAKVARARVLPPHKPKEIAKPVSLQNRGLVWPSTGLPVLATSDAGKRYVMWLAYPGKTTAPKGGLPLIPPALLADAPRGPFQDATGLRVWSDGVWSPPQLLLSGMSPTHDVEVAWCQGEDVHVILDTGDSSHLTHLCFQASDGKWTKVAALNHDVRAFKVRGRHAHLATCDYDGNRYGYRMFDGDNWSEVAWFKRQGTFKGVSISMAATDTAAHLVWNEGDGNVAHAVIDAEGKSKVYREKFSERPIAGSLTDYILVPGPSGHLALYYAVDLHGGHPDCELPHRRAWLGDCWSPAEPVSFGVRGFQGPVAVQYGGKVLLSWRYNPAGDSDHKIRGYSIRNKQGQWTEPRPLCLNEKGQPLDVPSVSLHVDRLGRVFTAWNVGFDESETFFAEVTWLGQ